MAGSEQAATPAKKRKHDAGEGKKKKKKRKQQHKQDSDSDAFFSPAASLPSPPQQQPQGGGGASAPAVSKPPPARRPEPVRVALTILPSPARQPMRGKRVPAISPAGVRPAGVRPAGALAAAGAVRPPAAAAAPRQAAAGQAPAAAGGRATAQAAAGAPAAGQPQQAGAGAEPARQRRQSAGGSGGSRGAKRKRLTHRGKRAAVLSALAEVELRRAGAEQGSPGAQQAPGAAAQQQVQQQQAAAPQQAAQQQAPQQQQQQQIAAPQQAQQQQQQAAAAAAPADPAATANLGRPWSREDIKTLTRLAEDRPYLLATIPQHPPEGELDWELIARHFGRYSAGGAAAKGQYANVRRLVKAARHEAKGGANYCDLVQGALRALPDGRGTIYDIQAVLKRDCNAKLDKFRLAGKLRWKAAVSEVLREQDGTLFEQAGRSAGGKIIWKLRAQ